MVTDADIYDSLDAVHPGDGVHPLQSPDSFSLGGGEITTGTPPMIGICLAVSDWLTHVATYDFGSLAPTRLVLHHTYRPDESQWQGLASMRGMQSYYAGLGWNSAPHIYAGPDGIWLFTPMRDIGIHAGTGNGSLAEGWYSIGLEMVGNFDEYRPAGAVWEYAKAVMGGLSRRLGIDPRRLISFHRDYTDQKSCPGWSVTKEWVWSEVDTWLATTPSVSPYSPASPLLGTAQGTVDAAIAYLAPRATYTPASVSLIAHAYAAIGEQVGLDWFLALAQCAHETGSLTSWWSQRPRRNPAGLGVTGRMAVTYPKDFPTWVIDPLTDRWTVIVDWVPSETGRWAEGLAFPTWVDHAIPAHLGRLLAYATATPTVVQQELIDRALWYRGLPARYRGCALTLAGLGGTWAVSGTEYAQRIAAIANEMARAA